MTLHLSTGRGVLHVRLDRPEGRNSITPGLLQDLHAALDSAEADPGCRVLVLSARGEDFCAGTDLSAGVPEPLAATGDTGGTGDAGNSAGARMPYWTLLDRLTRTPLATVAVVDARALAGGVGLAAACDLVLAGPRARFRLTETLVGLVPAMALPFVARRTGEQRAFTATLLAEEFDAAGAVAAGLADTAADDTEEALRRTLMALSRTDRPTTSALKDYRARLFPRPEDLGGDAGRIFLDRLTDPAVQRLIAERAA